MSDRMAAHGFEVVLPRSHDLLRSDGLIFAPKAHSMRDGKIGRRNCGGVVRNCHSSYLSWLFCNSHDSRTGSPGNRAAGEVKS